MAKIIAEEVMPPPQERSRSAAQPPNGLIPFATFPTSYLTQTTLLTLVLVVVYLVFHVSVLLQFNMRVEWQDLVKRSLTALPALFAIVYVTHRLRDRYWMQVALFVVSIGVGLQNMQLMTAYPVFHQLVRSPGLGTSWVYALIQMDLLNAIFSLCLCFSLHIIGKVFLG